MISARGRTRPCVHCRVLVFAEPPRCSFQINYPRPSILDISLLTTQALVDHVTVTTLLLYSPLCPRYCDAEKAALCAAARRRLLDASKSANPFTDLFAASARVGPLQGPFGQINYPRSLASCCWLVVTTCSLRVVFVNI